MGENLGYFITWTTYGTWLPGDHRGWVDRKRKHGEGAEDSRPALASVARGTLVEPPLILDRPLRAIVEQVIRRICGENQWRLQTLQVRSNHVHLVVTAPAVGPGHVMALLKVRATQALRGVIPRRHYWTRYGSMRYLKTETSLQAAIRYVLDQDKPDRHMP